MEKTNNPWTFIADLSHKKEYLFKSADPQLEKEYNSFLTNKNFSHFPDTVLLSNDLNKAYNLDNKLQFDYYFYSIRKRYRKSEWYKKTDTEDIKIIKKKYNYNQKRAEEVLPLITKPDLDKLKQSLFIGGSKKSYNF